MVANRRAFLAALASLPFLRPRSDTPRLFMDFGKGSMVELHGCGRVEIYRDVREIEPIDGVACFEPVGPDKWRWA